MVPSQLGCCHMLKLYDYFRSSASFRVRIALNLKNVTYDVIPVHLVKGGGEQHQPEYLQINPSSLVPSLTTNDGVITQSIAIIEWLNETYSKPPLLPTGTYGRALCRSFALNIACDIHPLNNLRVLKYLTEDLAMTETQKTGWYQHWVMKGLQSLENQLKLYGTAEKYCFGNQVSLADICLVPQMYNARRFNCDLSTCPELVRIDAECQKLEAIQKAWPEEAHA